MVFKETILFSKYLKDYLKDDEYQQFQQYLIDQPDAGDLIKGTGGLRKLRWGLEKKGKRGGIRVIYYWQIEEDQIYLLALYSKNDVTDLSSGDKKALKKMVEDWQ
jgi:mRNA-degrading endonuclease RelE of RelBE toxin-antitoxin system